MPSKPMSNTPVCHLSAQGWNTSHAILKLHRACFLGNASCRTSDDTNRLEIRLVHCTARITRPRQDMWTRASSLVACRDLHASLLCSRFSTLPYRLSSDRVLACVLLGTVVWLGKVHQLSEGHQPLPLSTRRNTRAAIGHWSWTVPLVRMIKRTPGRRWCPHLSLLSGG